MKIGYARVSTVKQNLDGQLALLISCEKIFQEKVSGSRDDRPELLKLLEFVREGDTVYVTSVDRLARNVKHLQEIVGIFCRKNVNLHILDIGMDTSTPTGQMMISVFGAVAEFERVSMKERQAVGIALAKEKGKYTGREPTARNKSEAVLEMLDKGMTKAAISRELGIGISSIYRIIRAK